MKKNTSSLKKNRIAFIPILIFSLLALALADLDHCSVTKPHDTIGLLNTQSVSLTLGDYIRGYDLEFTSTQSMNARPFNPLNSVGSVEFNFAEGYNIINSDVNKCNCGRWFQQGVVFAQKDTKNIGLVLTKFTGTRTVADVLQHQYYTLDVPAVCFSARVVDSDYNVVLDCQTTDPNDQSDYMCYISTKDKKIKSCLQIDSLNDVKDRKSEILALGDETFLVTASYSRNKDSGEMSYLTIYRIDNEKGTIEFSNIIDGYQLGFDYDLVISDFEVKLGGKIYIHDMAKSQILVVKYTKTNEVLLAEKPWVYGSEGVEIQVSNLNTILIATKTHVEQWDLTLKSRVFRYELPKTDNEVNSISVSTWGVVVTTQKNNLYVYQRIMSPANYILGSMEIKQKKFLLSPYSNILYTFSEKQYQLIEMTSGTLSLTGITESQNITITAQSSTSQCSFTLEIIAVESTSKILTKQNIGQKQFVAESSQILNFNLEEIFSGQNLRYNVPKSTDEIKYTLEQLNEYSVESDLKDAELRQVVTLNKTTFLQLGLWATQSYLEMCTVNEDEMKITCKNVYSGRIMAKNPILIAGKQRKTGQVVFVWTAQETQFEMLSYDNGKIGTSYVKDGVNYEFSSIVIGEDKTYLVMKQYGMIAMYNDLGYTYTYTVLDAKSFSIMNKDLVGFYPRELYLHPRNNEYFYVKFPRHVCLMTVFGTIPKAIDCVQVLDRIIPEEQWTVIVGTQSYVVITPNQITEYSILGNANSALHSISIPSVLFPVYYNQFLNTIIMRATGNMMIYYKLNKPVIDSIYFETQLKSQEENGEEMISAEGYWALNGLGTKAYRQSYNTKLSVELLGDNKSFKEDLNISISVKGKEDEIRIDDNVTVIKYQTKINSQNQTNSGIQMPAHATQTVRIPINISEYFTGPKANYHIVCDYCDDTIKLEAFFLNRTANNDLKGSARSITQVFGNYIVVLTTNNMLYLIDKDDQLSVKVSIKIENVKQCQQMAWSQNLGLMVFCTDANGQQLVQFTVNETTITQWPSSYQLHQQSMINTVSEIIISQIADSDSYWVLIHDNDASVSSLSKTGNVKSFLLSKNVLEFKGIVNSMTFNKDVNQPINDIEVEGSVVMVTIGNFGLGYGWLNSQVGDQVMTNIGSVELKKIDAVKSNLLDSSIIQQVDILSVTDSTYQVLVTSSSSIPMVLSLVNNNNVIQFKQVSETYNRYGQLQTVNWHAVNDNVLLLKYYNPETFEEYIVGYNRTQGALMTDFMSSLTRQLTLKKSVEHTLFLTSQGHLIISEITQNDSSELARYNVSPAFNFVLTYEQPGTFSSITLTSSNYFSSQNVEIIVDFDHDKNNDDSGVKWYTVFIIALIVLIICGIAYGMYLKMMKHRKDKKVSLLTEGEQVDEQI